MPELQWTGTCRGLITEYSLFEATSGAVAVNLTAQVEEYWDDATQGWVDAREGDLQTSGAIWVVKKDGSLNQSQVEALVKHAGWDGCLESISTKTWQPKPCAFTISEDSYKDETRYRISWINGFEDGPQNRGNVSAEKAKVLQGRYGSQLRAIAGNVARNAVPPAGPIPQYPINRAAPFPDPNLTPPAKAETPF